VPELGVQSGASVVGGSCARPGDAGTICAHPRERDVGRRLFVPRDQWNLVLLVLALWATY
jgi:hypothetical protein